MKIGKNWQITSNNLNITLSRKRTRVHKDTNEKYEDWEDVGYFANIENALSFLIHQKVRDTELKDLKTIIEALSKVEKSIGIALKSSVGHTEGKEEAD